MQGSIIFISSPYSHSDKSIQNERFETACKLVAILLNNGKFPISPIIHGHPTTKYNVRGDWEFWRDYCYKLIDICDIVYVLDMEGWEESTGILSEIQYAKSLEKEIYLINHKNGKIIKKI